MYEANFRLVVEKAPDGIVIVDAEGCIVLVNLAAERLFGYPRDQLLGQPVEVLIEPQARDGHPAHRRRFLAAPSARPMGAGRVLTALRKDGSVCPVEVALTPLNMPSGAVTMATVIDISERRRTEEELRRSEARFRAIAENFPGVIFQRVVFPDGRLEYPYVSPSVERVFAVPMEAMLGVRSESDLGTYIAADDRRSAMELLQQAAATSAPVELESRIRGTDGRVRWVRSISRPTHPRPDGAVVWDGVMLDVTEHKLAQQQLDERTRELRTAKRKLEALVANAAEIVWTLNPDGVPEEDSPSRRAFTGESLDEWMSGGCYDAIHPDDRREVARSWAEARHTGLAGTYEYRLRHVSGDWRWMRVHRVPLRNDEGELTGWVGMNKDITEEKKAKEQLLLVNSELSHRIKNLLSIIIAIAQESGQRATGMAEYLDDFRSRLEGLARSQDVLMKGRWESVDLDELVRSHLDSFIVGADSTRISIAGPPLKLKADVAQTLGMAFHELATNAMKYGALSSPGGHIGVSWTVQPNGTTNEFALTWTESGGPDVRQPPRSGYGSVVVTKLVGRATRGHAHLDFRPGGAHWSLQAPWECVADASTPPGGPAGGDGAAGRSGALER